MPYCYNCGSEVSPEASFCKKCGRKIEIPNPLQTTPNQTPTEYVPPPPPPSSPSPLPPPPPRQTPIVGFAPEAASYSPDKSKLWLTLFIVVLLLLVGVGAILGFSYASASSKLNTTKATLATTQQQVTSLQADKTILEDKLSNANNSLASTQQTLTSTQNELASTKTQLNSTQTELSSTKTQLSAVQTQLSTAQNQLSSASSELSSAKSQLTDSQSQLASSMQQLTDYKKTMQGLGITVHSSPTQWIFNGLTWIHNDNSQATNPTYDQLMAFINQDKTDQHPYDANSFNCVNYSTSIYNNAEAANIEAAMVSISLKNAVIGHAVNAYITSDYGLVYVDCTGRDTIARVETGKLYRAMDLGAVRSSQIRNDNWWDGIPYNYYYLLNDNGGQAVVDTINIWW